MALYKNENGTAVLYSGTPGVMNGATANEAGTSGLVPAPTTADRDKFLKGDGTWGTVSASGSTSVTTDATPTQNSTNPVQSGGVYTALHATKPINEGGTGATSASAARTNLGLGTAATANTTTSITSNGTGLPTAGSVYTALNELIATTTTDPGEGAPMTSQLLIVYEE